VKLNESIYYSSKKLQEVFLKTHSSGHLAKGLLKIQSHQTVNSGYH